jgi:quercetin dioxygenase-like cupin family protein
MSSTPSPHRIHRHPAAPWAALRVSVGTQDCYRPHSHPEYSVGIVDEGGATFHHPSGPQPVRAGSVVLIEPQVVHACNPAAGQPGPTACCSWTPPGCTPRWPGVGAGPGAAGAALRVPLWTTRR